MSRPIIVIAGSLAQRPSIGGHAWVFLQYLLGFQRLGYRVLFLDSLDAGMCVDRHGNPTGFTASWNLDYFLDVMRRFNLAGSFSLDYNKGEQIIGLSRVDVLEQLRSSDVLINVMGYLADAELLAAPRRRAFLDIDPGFGQMWRDLGWADLFAGHDQFVTIGLNIGRPECIIPTCGLDWITTPQPVVLDEWPVVPPPADRRFTSVISWRGPFGPIDYKGQRYGLRCHEFRKFIDLPARTGVPFELAMDLHPDEAKDRTLLEAHGWQIVPPADVVSSPDDYQRYIQGSAGELMIAKNLYVGSNSGWFSDRTICYLASGRPAIVQDTGLAAHLPLGEGLLAFSTPDEAAAAVEAVERDSNRQAKRAREIAEAYFDSDKVLSRLIAKLGIG